MTGAVTGTRQLLRLATAGPASRCPPASPATSPKMTRMVPARRAWLEALPRTVADLADRWSLEVGRPFQPGGNASWVAPARDAAGRRLVLKAGWRHEEAEHEAGLRAWNGQGAVRVFRSLVTGDTSA
jgi:hypothetical protein